MLIDREPFMIKLWSTRLGLAFGSLAMTLLILEGVTRFAFGRHMSYAIDDSLYWVPKPSQQGYPRFGSPVATINADGFRGTSLLQNCRNIFMLGDSFTFGSGVRDDEVFTHYLQQRVDEMAGGYQVMNLGVPGWGLFQENIQLSRMISAYQPELVVLTLVKGDLNRLPFDDSDRKTTYLQRARLRSLFRASALLCVAKEVLGGVLDTNFGATENYRSSEKHSLAQLWKQNQLFLDEIYHLCDGRQVPLVLIAYPCSGSDCDEFVRLLRQFSEERHILLIDDVGDLFDRVGHKSLLTLPGDVHPSALAHQLLADHIFLKLTQAGLVRAH